MYDCYGNSCIQQEEGSFYWHIGLGIEEETSEVLHLEHSLIWCWNFDASGSRDQKHLESFEMWCWWRMEEISWTDHVRNENRSICNESKLLPTQVRESLSKMQNHLKSVTMEMDGAVCQPVQDSWRFKPSGLLRCHWVSRIRRFGGTKMFFV